jgi:hypothetical protein
MLLARSTSLAFQSLPTNCLTAGAAGMLLALCGCGGNIGFSPTGPSTPVSAVPAGPQLGYAWKADDQTLRPFLGVPGSSQIGESVVPASTYVAGGASAASALALVVGVDQQVYRVGLPNGTPAQVGVAATAGTKIRLSASGTAAVLYVPGSLQIAEVTHLTAAAVQVRQFAMQVPVLDAAVSNAGSVVVLLQATGGVAVDLLTGTGSAEPLANVSAAGGVGFVGTSEDLLVADAAANTLTWIRSVSTTPSATLVPTSNQLKSPVAVGAAQGGRWAVVANSGDSSVVRVDLTGATAPQRIACAAQPTVAEQLYGNGVFRFNEIAKGPLWIADITASNPSMLFIPALPSSGPTGGARPGVGR